MEKGSTYKRLLFYCSWVAFLLLLTGCGEEAGWKPAVSQEALDHPPRAFEWRLEHGFDLHDVWTENGTDIWAVGEGGVILYSSNDGQTWNQQSSPTNEDLYAIHGEGDRLWGVGDRGVIVHTVDGGQTWNEQSSPTREALNAIHGEGDRLWGVGDKGKILIGTARGFHFQVSEVRLADQLTGASLELKFQDYSRFGKKTDVSGVQFELLGANAFNQEEDHFKTLVVDFSPKSKDSLTWQASFDPASFDVESGQDIYWRLTVTQDGFRQVYNLPALTYNRWGWVKEQWYWLALFGYVLGLPLVLGGLLLTRPLWVLRLYRKVKFGEVLDTVKKVSHTLVWVARLLLSLFVVPFFIHHRRVLDAWVARHAGAVEERFKKLRTVNARLAYVPLPVRHDHRTTGTLFEQPSPEDLRPFFAARRVAVEMVGPGGSGKSTLAVQVGLWALHHQPEKRLTAHRMLPVLIEEDTQDLFGVVQRKLQSWLDEPVERHLLEALLAQQRLLIIFDALSERSSETRAHVRSLHGINALVVTTRSETSFEGGHEARLYPQPLTPDKLLLFITTLLVERKTEAFKEPEAQLELGQHLARLIKQYTDEVPLTPLLVSRAVEKAIELKEAGKTLDDLPDSIPGLYFDYLRRVNPEGDDTPNRLRHDDMQQVAEVLAALSLKGDFVPKDFDRFSAWKRLADHGWKKPVKPDDLDPLRRLIDNGVLAEQSDEPEFLRFALDPIAEMLAARKWGRDCREEDRRKECACWDELEQKVKEKGERAEGFLLALHMVRQKYGPECDQNAEAANA